MNEYFGKSLKNKGMSHAHISCRYKFLVSLAYCWPFMVVDHVRSETCGRYRKSKFKLISWSLGSCHSQLLDVTVEPVSSSPFFSVCSVFQCICFAIRSMWNEKELSSKLSHAFVDREIYEKVAIVKCSSNEDLTIDRIVSRNKTIKINLVSQRVIFLPWIQTFNL